MERTCAGDRQVPDFSSVPELDSDERDILTSYIKLRRAGRPVSPGMLIDEFDSDAIWLGGAMQLFKLRRLIRIQSMATDEEVRQGLADKVGYYERLMKGEKQGTDPVAARASHLAQDRNRCWEVLPDAWSDQNGAVPGYPGRESGSRQSQRCGGAHWEVGSLSQGRKHTLQQEDVKMPATSTAEAPELARVGSTCDGIGKDQQSLARVPEGEGRQPETDTSERIAHCNWSHQRVAGTRATAAGTREEPAGGLTSCSGEGHRDLPQAPSVGDPLAGTGTALKSAYGAETQPSQGEVPAGGRQQVPLAAVGGLQQSHGVAGKPSDPNAVRQAPAMGGPQMAKDISNLIAPEPALRQLQPPVSEKDIPGTAPAAEGADAPQHDAALDVEVPAATTAAHVPGYQTVPGPVPNTVVEAAQPATIDAEDPAEEHAANLADIDRAPHAPPQQGAVHPSHQTPAMTGTHPQRPPPTRNLDGHPWPVSKPATARGVAKHVSDARCTPGPAAQGTVPVNRPTGSAADKTAGRKGAAEAPAADTASRPKQVSSGEAPGQRKHRARGTRPATSEAVVSILSSDDDEV